MSAPIHSPVLERPPEGGDKPPNGVSPPPEPRRYGHKGIYVRLPPDILDPIEMWMRVRNIESTPEAIREILLIGLKKVSEVFAQGEKGKKGD